MPDIDRLCDAVEREGGALFGNVFALPPKAGGLLVFPSWLCHWVHPYAGPGERISLAFNNLRLENVRRVE